MSSKGKHLCLVCKKSVARATCIPCYVCEQYSHPKCSNVSDDLLKYLTEETRSGKAINWTCEHCQKVGKIFDRKLRLFEHELNEMRNDISEMKACQDKMKVDILEVKSKSDKNEKETKSITKSMQDTIFSELRQREDKKSNVIFHGIPEARSDLPGVQKKESDIDNVISVVNEILKHPMVRNDIKFIKRLGEINSENSRPLLLGCFSEDLKCEILKSSRMLADSEYYYEVRVSPDLTSQQRKEEVDMWQEAARLNSELSEEDALNYEWRLVGTKGSKRLVYQQKRENQARGRREGGMRRGGGIPTGGVMARGRGMKRGGGMQRGGGQRGRGGDHVIGRGGTGRGREGRGAMIGVAGSHRRQEEVVRNQGEVVVMEELEEVVRADIGEGVEVVEVNQEGVMGVIIGEETD